MKPLPTALILCLLCTLPASLSADVVHLKNGGTLEGRTTDLGDRIKIESSSGTVVLPKDRTKLFNQLNDYMDFDEVDEVRTYPFEPNQALVFIKTFNSWHAVWPMRGNDPDRLRRNLTINIEAI